MSFETSHARWQAVASRLRAADGHFVYAVKSTRIYCRPTCPARLARRANVDFYRTAADAVASGYRPCKRCKPETAGPEEDSQGETVQRACDVLAKWARIGAAPDGRTTFSSAATGRRGMGLKELATEVGKTPRYLHKIFKDRMGVTPKQYAEQMSELYRPPMASLDLHGMADGTDPLGVPLDETPFYFDALDFDYVDATLFGLEGQTDSDGTLADGLPPLNMTDGTFSPGGLPHTPRTPDDPLVTDLFPATVEDLVAHAQDLPALSSTALDGILADALTSDLKTGDRPGHQASLGELAEWVWEAEWSNAVIDSYHRTAAVL